MNEPEQPDTYRWQGIQPLVAQQIRTAAPNNTIIACGARWTGLEDLLPLQPLALPNNNYTTTSHSPSLTREPLGLTQPSNPCATSLIPPPRTTSQKIWTRSQH